MKRVAKLVLSTLFVVSVSLVTTYLAIELDVLRMITQVKMCVIGL